MNFFNKIKSIFIKNKAVDKNLAYNGINVKFSAETEKTRLKNEKELYVIIKKYINSPEKLINLLTKQELKIYRIKNCEKILKTLNFEEGFIFPQKGLKALKLNFIIKSFELSFKTPPMLIFETNSTEIYTIAYALHKYYSFKSKLPGCDEKSQQLFYKARTSKNKISQMHIKDISMCKDAIERDTEAINFAIRISKEFAGAKNALDKIKSDNSAML